jgi:hypothetical protein
MFSSLSLLDLRYEDQTMGRTHTSALLTVDRLSLISPAQSISNRGVLFRGTKGHFEGDKRMLKGSCLMGMRE